MSIRKRVLFLYITVSSGHQRAAEAVMSALRHMNPRVECHALDTVGYTYPLAGKVVSRFYLEILKHAPRLWDFLYDNPTIEQSMKNIREIIHLLNTGKMYTLLKTYRPRCLVCTQAMPAGVMAALKERGKIKIPLIAVVTDFGVHAYWISKHIDLYLVPTEDIKKTLLRHGIREDRVRVTGIPIDPVFIPRADKAAVRAQLGLRPDQHTLLLMGGSRGLGPMDDIVDVLRHAGPDVQVMVACGANHELQKDLHARFPNDRRVKIFGPTKHIHRLMDAADVLISKPGGMTTAEAMAKGLAMVMVHPIPGQEERNAAFLTRHSAAERADSLNDLRRVVHSLLLRPEKRARLSAQMAALARPRAAYDAAESILGFLKEPVLWNPAQGEAHAFAPDDGNNLSEALLPPAPRDDLADKTMATVKAFSKRLSSSVLTPMSRFPVRAGKRIVKPLSPAWSRLRRSVTTQDGK